MLCYVKRNQLQMHRNQFKSGTQVHLRRHVQRNWMTFVFNSFVCQDQPGHQESVGFWGQQTDWCWSGLCHPRSLQCHCEWWLPIMDHLHPGDDLRGSGKLPVESIWRDEGKLNKMSSCPTIYRCFTNAIIWTGLVGNISKHICNCKYDNFYGIANSKLLIGPLAQPCQNIGKTNILGGNGVNNWLAFLNYCGARTRAAPKVYAYVQDAYHRQLHTSAHV